MPMKLCLKQRWEKPLFLSGPPRKWLFFLKKSRNIFSVPPLKVWSSSYIEIFPIYIFPKSLGKKFFRFFFSPFVQCLENFFWQFSWNYHVKPRIIKRDLRRINMNSSDMILTWDYWSMQLKTLEFRLKEKLSGQVQKLKSGTLVQKFLLDPDRKGPKKLRIHSHIWSQTRKKLAKKIVSYFKKFFRWNFFITFWTFTKFNQKFKSSTQKKKKFNSIVRNLMQNIFHKEILISILSFNSWSFLKNTKLKYHLKLVTSLRLKKNF